MPKLTWEERLKSAEKRGKFLVTDIKDVDQWSSGVLGEWKGFFLADEDGAPYGNTLHSLDGMFAEAVANNDLPTAKKAYSKIQSYIKNNIRRRSNPLTKSTAKKKSLKITNSPKYVVTAKLTGVIKAGKKVAVKATMK